jgi:hypothetical protein
MTTFAKPERLTDTELDRKYKKCCGGATVN